MTTSRVLRLYLDRHMRAGAESGRARIITAIRTAFEGAEFRVEYVSDTAQERAKAAGREGFHLFHMHEPEAPNTLVLRGAYYYPFWRIEATNERWAFDVARAPFAPDAIDPGPARAFIARRRRQIFGARTPRRQGFVFMPLQGRLTQHRSFQAMSPLDMIAATRAADPKREILLRLHPKESYEDGELAELRALIRRLSGVRLARRPAVGLLADCDYVVTENSSLALTGFFAEKPAVLFAEIDFHHIAAPVVQMGVDAAFRAIQAPPPDFARYLWWFLREQSIDATAGDAGAQILARARRFGWPV